MGTQWTTLSPVKAICLLLISLTNCSLFANSSADLKPSCPPLVAGHARFAIPLAAKKKGKKSALDQLRDKADALSGLQTPHFRDPYLFAVTLDHRLQIWRDAIEAIEYWRDEHKLKASENILEVSRRLSVEKEVNLSSDDCKALENGLKEIFDSLLKDKKTDQSSAYFQRTVWASLDAFRRLENYHARAVKAQRFDEFQQLKKPEEKKNTGKKKKKAPPPFYPNIMDSYQAAHLNTDGALVEQVERQKIASINQPKITQFHIGMFSSINARNGQWHRQKLPAREITRLDRTHKRELILQAKGRTNTWLPVLLPKGYVPTRGFKDQSGTLALDQMGTWVFQSTKEEFRIPLVRELGRNYPLSPPEVDLYTESTGVDPSEWEHAALQKALKGLKAFVKKNIADSDPNRSVKIASLLQKVFPKIFYYDVDEQEHTDMLKYVKEGALQCSSALTLAASLLREAFNVPCRIRSFAHGYHLRDEPGFSHAISPGAGHVVLEVPDGNGQWHEFDYTPTVPNRKRGKEEKKDEFRPNEVIEGEEGGEGEGGTPDESDSEGEGQDSDNSTDKDEAEDTAGKDSKSKRSDETLQLEGEGASLPWKKLLEAIEAKQKELSEKVDKKKKERGIENSDDGNDDKSKNESELDVEISKGIKDITRQISQVTDSPFVKRFLIGLVVDAVVNDLPAQQKQIRLQMLSSYFEQAEAEIAGVELTTAMIPLKEAQKLFRSDLPSLTVRLNAALQNAKDGEMRKASEVLQKMSRELQFMIELLDPGDERPVVELLHRVQTAERALVDLKSDNSQFIAAAHELYSVVGLPTRKELDTQYGITSIGENAPSINFGKAILRGAHKDLRLRAVLAPYTDFAVRPIIVPRFSELPSPLDDLRLRVPQWNLSTDPRDGLRARTPSALPIGMDAVEAAAMGMLPVERMPLHVRQPVGNDNQGQEEMLFVLWDTSGSMGGNRAKFVAEYLKAIVDRAGSKVDENGRMLQQVYFLPFDGSPGKYFKVTSAKEIAKALRSGNLFGNTRGGTDITKAVCHVPRIITNETRHDPMARHRFRKFTIVIFTDGEDTVKRAPIQAAFRSFKGKSELLFAYVATGAVNYDLLAFVKEGQTNGPDQSLFYHWDDATMAEILGQASKKPKVENAFWSERTWSDLSQQNQRELEQLSSGLGNLSGPIRPRWMGETKNSKGLRTLIDRLDLSGKPPPKSRKHLTRQMQTFRHAIHGLGVVLSDEERALAFEYVAKHWGILTGNKSLSDEELAELFWMLNWVDKGLAYDI